MPASKNRLLQVLVSFVVSTGAAAQPPELGLDDVGTLEFGVARPLTRELYSFNSNLLMVTALHGIDYSSIEFQTVVRDLSPGGLRFPGGTTANNYLWREDSFSLQDDDKTGWAAQQLQLFRKMGRKYDLPGFATTCRDLGMTPIYVLNVYEEEPDDIPDLFKRFDELGLDVQSIELGNEPYWDPRSLMNVWKYIDSARPLAQAIRAHRPDVKIGACFGPLRKGSTFAEKWNAPLAKQQWFDAVVYHEYYGGQGFAMEKGEALPLYAVLHPETFVDEPVESFAYLVPDKPIWFTEWNIGAEGLKHWKNTGGELLFAAAVMIRILEHQANFEWSCFHQIHEQKFGTFTYEKGRGVKTLPIYELFRLIGAAYSGGEAVRLLDSEPSSDLRGFLVENNDGPRIILLNRGDETRAMRLPNSAGGQLSALSISAFPEETLTGSTEIARRLAIAGDQVNLPPHSVTLFGSEQAIVAATAARKKLARSLFPARPHLSLWYEPYAKRQPRVSAEGTYSLDLNQIPTTRTAIVTMDLSSLAIATGTRLRLALDGSSSEGIGTNVRLPDANNSHGLWAQLARKASEHTWEFDYDAEVNNGNVTFVLASPALEKGGNLVLQNFELTELKGR